MTRRWALAAMVLTVFAASAAPAGAVTLLPGFTDEVVTTVGAPTAFAFTPDGRMLITTQPGRLRVFSGGTLLTTPALDLSASTCSNSERGMLGVAVDPSFAANGYVYIFRTFNSAGTCVNRVSRFVMSGNTISPATEFVLVDNMPSTAGNHNAGDVQFGKDGYLYISIGDGGCDYADPTQCAGANNAARDQNVLTGKILRITPTGAIPPTNPYLGPDSALRRHRPHHRREVPGDVRLGPAQPVPHGV